jgi:hypothetical protein
MTNEEALEVIKQDIPCEQDFDLIEALTMAIKALEQADVLQEIRQEIAQIKATQLYSTIDLKDMVLATIDKHMEEHHD